jgi:hypothetical protein
MTHLALNLQLPLIIMIQVFQHELYSEKKKLVHILNNFIMKSTVKEFE